MQTTRLGIKHVHTGSKVNAKRAVAGVPAGCGAHDRVRKICAGCESGNKIRRMLLMRAIIHRTSLNVKAECVEIFDMMESSVVIC